METTMTTSTFARNLSALLSINEKPMKVIADEIGISVGALSNYQNNRATANIDALRKIAQYFNVSADWLIGLSDAPSPKIDIQEIHQKTGLWEDAIIRLFAEKDNKNPEISEFISYLSVNPHISSLISAIKEKNGFDDGQNKVSIDIGGERYSTDMKALFKMIVSDLFFDIIAGYITKPGEIMTGYKAGGNNG